MSKRSGVLVFIIGFLCAWSLFSVSLRNVTAEPPIPKNISFSGESNVIYFWDGENAKLYRYNTHGRLTRVYTLKELGEDLQAR